MTERTEADCAPSENPQVPMPLRPWHAPEFYLMDVGATENSTHPGEDGPHAAKFS
jgi:hypothetical protein